jgi:hypothetical protein
MHWRDGRIGDVLVLHGELVDGVPEHFSEHQPADASLGSDLGRLGTLHQLVDEVPVAILAKQPAQDRAQHLQAQMPQGRAGIAPGASRSCG